MKHFSRTMSVFMGVILLLSLLTFTSDAADTYSVSGSVKDSTTSSTLYLSTSQGDMTIAIDPETDTSECRMLLPGKNVTVECHRGDDAVLHASRISSRAAVDQSSTATVYGTVLSKTTDTKIFLSTVNGTMEIVVDTATDMTGCHVLTVGQKVYIDTARGSDAYMHALRISSAQTTAAGSGSDTAVVNGVTMPNLIGTVSDKTTADTLYFSTSGGTMIIKYDSTTDYTGCMTLFPGQEIEVACYRGADAYMHAARIGNISPAGYATAGNYTSTMTATGTVEPSSSLNTLYLHTDGGRMTIKLDNTTSVPGFAIVSGSKITVSLGRGSDEYWHAISITR